MPSAILQESAPGRYGWLLSSALVVALCATRWYSYLLFHTLVELFTVAVAWSTFFLAWNARRFFDNDYLLLLGIAGLFTGGLDALHALAYRGMGVFVFGGADFATQLWIAARCVQAVALVVAPVFFRRRLNVGWMFATCFLGTAALLVSIATGLFPACYREATGLTGFKIASEYAITAMMTVSAVLLQHQNASMDDGVRRRVMTSILLTITAELTFTLYSGVYDMANMAGHLVRFLAFCLIYRAIVVTGIVQPFTLLFRNLQAANATLESTVTELRRALLEVKTLSGLVPICAKCKNIRDDRGYWTQVEAYVASRTDASFSHSICPDCLAALYPEYVGDLPAKSSDAEPVA